MVQMICAPSRICSTSRATSETAAARIADVAPRSRWTAIANQTRTTDRTTAITRCAKWIAMRKSHSCGSRWPAEVENGNV